MTILRLKYGPTFFSVLIFLFISNIAFGQSKYTLQYIFADKDTLYPSQQIGLNNNFQSKEEAEKYINQLPSILLNKGFAGASIDSVNYGLDSARIFLYLGIQYKWEYINTDSVENQALENIGWHENQFKNQEVHFSKLELLKENLLNYYENSGYPFAKISLNNVQIVNGEISGNLKVDKGILYHVDSIRVYGKLKISNQYLQHYLSIFNGSIYSQEKLDEVSKKLKELPFLQEEAPWTVTMLGSGSILNLYLIPKRSSQINVLIGFLPSNNPNKKSQLTADVHLDLNNALSSGENILLNWQQLQPQSPRLNLGYKHPFIFNSNFGIDGAFDLLKQDSTYLQLSGRLGLQYFIAQNKSVSIFYKIENSYLLSGGIDTAQIKFTKKLPSLIDVSSNNFGLNYHFVNTNYRFNPRKGTELDITGSAGIRNVQMNNDIIDLKDPLNPSFDFKSLYDSIQLKSYRFTINAIVAQYLPIGKNSVIKTGINFGLIQSPQLFQNELFRIGGYRLLRGFDEESIYANKYAVVTGEYRYLLGTNSYFFGFVDGAITSTKLNNSVYSNSFISGGLGLEFETKFGLLNLSYAVGKRNDVKFDIRNSSKIHFGYINYF
jgi:outer membrane protein assembly factor BamA